MDYTRFPSASLAISGLVPQPSSANPISSQSKANISDNKIHLWGKPADLHFTLEEISHHIVESFLHTGLRLVPYLYGSRAACAAGGPPGNDWDMVVWLPPTLRTYPNLQQHIDTSMLALVHSHLLSREIHPGLARSYGLQSKAIMTDRGIIGWVYKFGPGLDIVFKFGVLQSYSALDSVYIDPITKEMHLLEGTSFTPSDSRKNELLAQIRSRKWVRLSPENLSYLRFMHHWAHGADIPAVEIEQARRDFRSLSVGVRCELLLKHQSQHFLTPKGKLVDLLNHFTLVQDNAEDCQRLAADWTAAMRGSFPSLIGAILHFPSSTPLLLKFFRGCLLHAYLEQNGQPGPIEAWTFRDIPTDQPRNFFALPCGNMTRFLSMSSENRVLAAEQMAIEFLEALVALSTTQIELVNDCRADILKELGLHAETFLQEDCSVALDRFLRTWIAPRGVELSHQFPLTSHVPYNRSARALCQWLSYKFGPSQAIQQHLARYQLEDCLPYFALQQRHLLAHFVKTVLAKTHRPVYQFRVDQLANVNKALKEYGLDPMAGPVPSDVRQSIQQLLLPRLCSLVRRDGDAGALLALAFIQQAIAVELLSQQEGTRLYRFLYRMAIAHDVEDSDWAVMVRLLLAEQGVEYMGEVSDHQSKLCTRLLANSSDVLMHRVTSPPDWVPTRPHLHTLLSSHHVLGLCTATASLRRVISNWRVYQRPPSATESLQGLRLLAKELAKLPVARQTKMVMEFLQRWPSIQTVFQNHAQSSKASKYFHAIRALSGQSKALREACVYQIQETRRSRQLSCNILQGSLSLPEGDWRKFQISTLEKGLERALASPAALPRGTTRFLLQRLLQIRDPAHWTLVLRLLHIQKPSPSDLGSLMVYFSEISRRWIEEGSVHLLSKVYLQAKDILPAVVLQEYTKVLRLSLKMKLSSPTSSVSIHEARKSLLLAQKSLPLFADLEPQSAQILVQDCVRFSSGSGQLTAEVCRLVTIANRIGLFDALSPAVRHGLLFRLLRAAAIANETVPAKDLARHMSLIPRLGTEMDPSEEAVIVQLGTRSFEHSIRMPGQGGAVDLSDLAHHVNALISNIQQSRYIAGVYILSFCNLLSRCLFFPTVVRIMREWAILRNPHWTSQDVLQWVKGLAKHPNPQSILDIAGWRQDPLIKLLKIEMLQPVLASTLSYCENLTVAQWDHISKPELPAALVPIILSIMQVVSEKDPDVDEAAIVASGSSMKENQLQYQSWQEGYHQQVETYVNQVLKGDGLEKAQTRLAAILQRIRRGAESKSNENKKR